MYDELLSTALLAARAGGDVLRGAFGAADLDVRIKGENDFVTRADRESERVVVDLVHARHPDHAVLGEEGGLQARSGDPATAEYQWVLDPLDGTTNFLQGLPIFCVSIACRRGRETVAAVVHEPLSGATFTATRGGGAYRGDQRLRASARVGLRGAFLATGYPFRAKGALDVYLAVFGEVFLQARAVRRCGAAALDLAYTAAGVYDGFFEFRLSPWDIAAGALLIEEAGGALCDLDGGDAYLRTGNLVAGAPGVLAELRAAVNVHAHEATVDAVAGPEAAVGAHLF
jgi:myo-inositol-1(or 4)-monophosphatase